jgi:hypothetical protein
MKPIIDAILLPAAHPAIAITVWNVPKNNPITDAIKYLLSVITVPAASDTAKQSIARAIAMKKTVRGSIIFYGSSHRISVSGIPGYSGATEIIHDSTSVFEEKVF